MLKLKWIPDLKAETDFREMNIPFAVKEIRFSQINLYESSNNGARLGDTIIANKVTDYAQAMRNENAFLRVVVFLDANYGYILTSGNQRCSAIKELIEAKYLPADPMIEVYVLETKDAMLLEAIGRSANCCHGLGSTMEERITHAVYMVRCKGMQLKDAAKLFIVDPSTISRRIKSEEGRKELGAMGIDTTRLPARTLELLTRINHDQQAFRQVGGLVAQHVPSGDRVETIVSRVLKAKSDPDRLKVVQQVEKELSQEAKEFGKRKKLRTVAPKAPARPWRDKLVTTFTKLADFLDFGHDGEAFRKLTDLQVATAADEKTIRELWARLELRMALLLKKGR